jgi:Methyltransferase domain
LAERLIKRLQSRPKSRVLDFASGSGRNAEALRRAGFSVVAIADDLAASQAPLAGVTERFSAAISTHGLLHGTPSTIAARVRLIAELLYGEGLLYATFGSTRDARFGQGQRIDDWTFAPSQGDERGVAHAYFDRDRLRALLEPHFEVESLKEHSVDEVAGSWAHRERPLSGAAHWFAVARKR